MSQFDARTNTICKISIKTSFVFKCETYFQSSCSHKPRIRNISYFIDQFSCSFTRNLFIVFKLQSFVSGNTSLVPPRRQLQLVLYPFGSSVALPDDDDDGE